MRAADVHDHARAAAEVRPVHELPADGAWPVVESVFRARLARRNVVEGARPFARRGVLHDRVERRARQEEPAAARTLGDTPRRPPAGRRSSPCSPGRSPGRLSAPRPGEARRSARTSPRPAGRARSTRRSGASRGATRSASTRGPPRARSPRTTGSAGRAPRARRRRPQRAARAVRRLSRKNSTRILPHSSARTPAVTDGRWLRRGSRQRSPSEPTNPAFGSEAP